MAENEYSVTVPSGIQIEDLPPEIASYLKDFFERPPLGRRVVKHRDHGNVQPVVRRKKHRKHPKTTPKPKPTTPKPKPSKGRAKKRGSRKTSAVVDQGTSGLEARPKANPKELKTRPKGNPKEVLCVVGKVGGMNETRFTAYDRAMTRSMGTMREIPIYAVCYEPPKRKAKGVDESKSGSGGSLA